ncbi:uncharacterized protein [Dermacentor albipictus]|uniref:uncharacterized protein isoform X2 n=1 Tax=Dermacentor albipictus TaxID=60249 RepID=UPI0031FC321C
MDKTSRLVLPACALCCLVFAVTRCGADRIDFKREAAGRLQSITNHTVELIGPWIYIARYLIYFMAKEPVRPDFFYDFLEQRTQPTFKNLINQVRIHQPYIYQLFQIILVLTNITTVVSISIVGLRSAGTCGASTSQDVTINYRLLFHTYTASALIICGSVIVGGVFVLTCDYRINSGVDLLGIFVHGYKNTIMNFLLTDVVNNSEVTFARMVHGLEQHHLSLRSSVLSATIHKQAYAQAIQQRIPGIRTLAQKLDNGSLQMKIDVIQALEDSTLFQRRALILEITDLISKVRGQLYIFTHEVENIKAGVENMTSILLSQGNNLLYIPNLQKVVTWSIMSFLGFLCLSMGGMMTGFILGYANHEDHASPMDRNRLSNIGGYFLVLTSYCMMLGVTGMLFFSGMFMLLGSIGDLYLCRATRGYARSSEGQLKDLAVSLVMNATVNRYHVLKLLRYSTIEKHCVEHQGIAGLAGIHPSALQTAFDNIVLTQYDLANHFSINIDKLMDGMTVRVKELKDFDYDTTTLKLIDNGAQYDSLKKEIKQEIDFASKVASDTVGFKKMVEKAFQDYSLVKCDDIKNDLLSYIDMFDNIGNCRKILGVFEESFRILCNGMLDYVNGFWLAMLILVGVFDYAIYISLVASKYLFTMTTYTYEGEAVPPGTNFEDLQTHRRQKPRRRRQAEQSAAVTSDQKLRLEMAEKYRVMRLKRMSREPDAVLKDISPTMLQSPLSMSEMQPTSVPRDRSSSVLPGLQPGPVRAVTPGPARAVTPGPARAVTPGPARVVMHLSQAKPTAARPLALRAHSDELAPEFR